jgi:DNA-binding GntR family transcriptional regulator
MRHGPNGTGNGLSMQGRVIAEMRRRIISGEIGADVNLSELTLAEEFGVSRTPVREALKRLIAEHLVSRDDRGGVAVHVPTPREVDDI